MYEVLKNGLYPKKVKAFDDFINLIERLKDAMKNMDLDKLVNYVLKETEYKKMLEDAQETERLENVKSLVDDVIEYSKVNNYEVSLSDYLQAVSLYTDKENTKITNCVKLMTIHSSKGLEFDVVFVINLSEGIFPNQRALQDGPRAIEEERRLAYVAFTRAKNKLFLLEDGSAPFITSGAKSQSRFIDEINNAYIEHCIDSSSLKQDNEFKIFDHYEEPIKRDSFLKEEAPFKENDVVVHDVFGEGVVLSIDEDVATIAFSFPHGVKQLSAFHPSIKLKNKLN